MSKIRILVVEDEAIVARDLCVELGRLGYEPVASVPRGEDALEMVERHRPDLVLMDVELGGGLDGVATAAMIRDRFETPVIFLTAYSDDALIERSKVAAPLGYILKPFNARDLRPVIEIGMAKHEAEQRLRDTREDMATILRMTLDGFWIVDAEGRLLEVNDAACTITGYSRVELLQKSVSDLDAIRTPEQIRENLAQVRARGSLRFERRHRHKDGHLIDVEISANSRGSASGQLVCFVRDITRRKREEEERETMVRLLRLINGENDLRGLIQAATLLLHDWSGCDAVAIRLRDGDDFPYYETSGFPPAFVEMERCLCQRDAGGRLVRDATGNPVLECMCGNILRGRFDPGKTFFTPHGSFWTNSTTDLLASTTETDRQARTRNRCHGEGYESVALVPLRVGETTYGLLQFNDKRRNRFVRESIDLLERLGDSLAVAIAQRQAQTELRASEERYRRLLESTTDYVYSFENHHGNMAQTRHGPGCVKVTGYSTADFAARPMLWFEMVPPEDQPTVQAFAAGILAGESPPPLEHRIVHKDGSIRWVRNSVVIRRDSGASDYTCDGLIADITARKQVELALRTSEAKFATLFRAAPVMITLSDIEQGAYLEVNDAFLQVSGFTAAEVIGATGVSLGWMAAEDRRLVLERLKHDGRVAGLPLTLTAKGGRRVACLYSGEVAEVDGRRRLLAISLDTTDRLRLEAQLRQAQKMEAVGQLAGGVAHDFNNILVAILLHLGLLRNEAPMDEGTRTLLLELEREATRAAGITRQLLTFSRRQVMQVKPVSLSDLLTNLLKMLRRLLGEDITIELAATAGSSWIEADVGMIEQVVVNLCVNARDAMPTGGRLTMAVEEKEFAAGVSQANPEARAGRFIRLSISDTGCGMDERVRQRIFEPFFTTKDAGKGTGLGLATVYGIVKQHGGWLEVESVVGHGSTFRVLLPARGAGLTAEEPTAVETVGRGRGETVLLVEDDDTVRTVLALTLQRFGYGVRVARNGPEALALWEAHGPEIGLLLTDVVMPHGLTGIELAERLHAARPSLPVIIASGYEKNYELPTAGEFTLLAKPFESQQLLALVRQKLDAAEAVRA